MTAASISQAVVLKVIRCGSGGGSPLGRRCRRALRIAAAGGGLTGASLIAATVDGRDRKQIRTGT